MSGRLSRAARAYRLLFITFILFASGRTALLAHSGHGTAGHEIAGHSPPFLPLLAGAEIVSAVAFLFRRTRAAAGIGLLLVFATGTAVGLADGELPFNLVFYAGTVGLLLALDRERTLPP